MDVRDSGATERPAETRGGAPQRRSLRPYRAPLKRTSRRPAASTLSSTGTTSP